MLLQVLVAHHQNMALGKGAVECDACFNVDRLGEVELNDFGAPRVCLRAQVRHKR
jgi:hypothetical protein